MHAIPHIESCSLAVRQIRICWPRDVVSRYPAEYIYVLVWRCIIIGNACTRIKAGNRWLSEYFIRIVGRIKPGTGNPLRPELHFRDVEPAADKSKLHGHHQVMIGIFSETHTGIGHAYITVSETVRLVVGALIHQVKTEIGIPVGCLFCRDALGG